MRYLYTIPFNEKDAELENIETAQQLAQQGLLTQDGVAVERISTEPSDLSLDGVWKYGDPWDKKNGKQLESLNESGFGAVPLYNPDGTYEYEGYYEIQSATIRPVHAATDPFWRFETNLSRVGTHESHWRAIRISQTDLTSDGTNPFNAASNEYNGHYVAIDGASDRTRWYAKSNGSEPANAVETVEQAFGSVFRFDPDNASFDPEYLIYQEPYAREGISDVVVWDPRDRSRHQSFHNADDTVGQAVVGDATVGRTVRANQWVHVFNTDFEFRETGVKVVGNDRIRLQFNESKQIIQAEEYNNGRFIPITIDHSTFLLYDVSLEQIGPARVDVYCEFERISDGSIEPVLISLQRGQERPFALLPENNSSIPTSLETMLNVIANDSSTDYEPTQQLIPRSEVTE